MAGITANWPIGRIRGKDETSGSGKTKERANEPNGPTWPTGPWKRREMARIGTQWATWEEALIWTMRIPGRDGKKK